jgi:hypothetical protein
MAETIADTAAGSGIYLIYFVSGGENSSSSERIREGKQGLPVQDIIGVPVGRPMVHSRPPFRSSSVLSDDAVLHKCGILPE